MATKLKTIIGLILLATPINTILASTGTRMRKSTTAGGFKTADCTASGGVWGNALISSGACDWYYTKPGSYTWTVPTGVTRVSVVCIGGGGGSSSWNGGGGGGLVYKNNLTVTPGNKYSRDSR